MARNEKIDLLKGIAIILVVMGHSMSDIEYMTLPFNFIYSFHMPLLFFLSGYLLEMSRDKYRQIGIKHFVVRKTVSLLVPYVSWSVLVPWLISLCSMDVLLNALINVTGIYGGGIWFLPVLYGLILMYALVWAWNDVFFKGKESFWKDVILLMISVLLLVLLVVVTRHPYLTNMISYSIPFWGGVFTKKFSWIENIINMKWVCVLVIGLYVLLFPLFNFYDTGMMTQVKRIVLSVFAIIVLWNLCDKEKYQNVILRIVIVCGQYSLAIYLIHGYFSRWKLVLEKFDSVMLGTVISVLGSLIICTICIGCAKILEKTKLTRKIFLGR